METIGEILRKARQEKKVDLEVVSKHTKIHINILRALEEDRFEGLNPVYVKGFLKIYGQYLGLNQQGLVKQYQGQFSPKKQEIITSEIARPDEPGLNINIANLSRYFKIVSLCAVCLVLLFVLSIAIKRHKQKVSPNKTLESIQPATTKTKLLKTPPPQPKKPVAPKTIVSMKPIVVKPSPVKQEAVVPVRATLHAKEDTWIQVRLDGKVIFQGILKKGKSENWQAKQTIEMSIGNAGAVELEVNGRQLSPLGRRGQSLKQVLINKEGVSIK